MMFDFAEQTGSGIVIMVWSYLTTNISAAISNLLSTRYFLVHETRRGRLLNTLSTPYTVLRVLEFYRRYNVLWWLCYQV
jgi:hypothetical protein